MDLLCRGEAYRGSVLPREPPGFFREKPRSEFSFLLEALEEGEEQEKLGVRQKMESAGQSSSVSGASSCRVGAPLFL